MNKKIQILDCTLRDGGYYNNWDFDAEILERYLASMADAQIDYVELGLRQLKNESFGARTYTTSEFLSRINLPEGPTYGGMIDAKTILTADGSHTENIDELFLDSKNEKIDLVRIAAHHSEVLNCFPMIEHLKRKDIKLV